MHPKQGQIMVVYTDGTELHFIPISKYRMTENIESFISVGAELGKAVDWAILEAVEIGNQRDLVNMVRVKNRKGDIS